ncbi:MAG TPA: SCO family protein [Polyangiaceae bacterium]|nr:SCO family protein [Polyangiaceae bacterium]
MRSRSFLVWFCLCVVAFLTGCRKSGELPHFGRVPAFSMKDQDGKPFSEDSVRGSVWAAAFVFTRCPTACPRVTRAMKDVQLDAKKRNLALRLVSFSIDPDNDTPEVLSKYAKEYDADTSTWTFATGNLADVQKTAEHGFKIAVEGTADPSKAGFGINHGTQLVLVDPELEIRGYYSTSDPAALTKVVEDAGTLAAR